MHVQQAVLTNGSATLMLEFELWAPRAVGTSGVIEVGASTLVEWAGQGRAGQELAP